MDEKALERWREKREKGLARYVAVQGVLGFGLPMFVVMTFIVNKRYGSVSLVLLQLAIWLVGGAVFGLLTWWTFERNYRKYRPTD